MASEAHNFAATFMAIAWLLDVAVCCVLIDVCHNLGSICTLQQQCHRTWDFKVMGIFVQGHKAIMLSVCMPVLHVLTYLIYTQETKLHM